MRFAPHPFRRSPHLWVLVLLAWLGLGLQAVVALPVAPPGMQAPMPGMAMTMHPPASNHAQPAANDCCGSPAAVHCACPAACTVAVPILSHGLALAVPPPQSGPSAADTPVAPKPVLRPPLRPPMA